MQRMYFNLVFVLFRRPLKLLCGRECERRSFSMTLIRGSFSPAAFPSCVLEVSTKEVDEFYSPRDFQLGQRIKLLGRCFLLYDCDTFTKEHYKKNHPDIEIQPTEVPKKTDKLRDWKRVRTKTFMTVLWNSLWFTRVFPSC